MGTTAEDVLIRFVAEDKVTPQLGQMRSAFTQTGLQGVSSIGNVNTAVGGLESSLGNLSNTLQTAGAVMGAVFGVYGLSQIYQQTVGVAALKEGYTYLMGGMMQSKQAASELMEATKEFSYSTPFMFRDYAYGLTLIRSTSSATKEEMEAMLPGMTNIALLYQLKGMDPKMGMLAYSQGLIGNFRSMRMQAGITADKLKEFGWSGQEGDIKSYTAAMDRYFEHMGLNASKMNTYEVSLAKFMSTFRAAMAGLGEILLPPLEKLLKFGTDVMQSIPKPAKIAGVAIVGLLFAVLAIMPWLPLMASGFWMIAGALGVTTPASIAAAAAQEMHNVALAQYMLAAFAASGASGVLIVNHAMMTPVNLAATASTWSLTGAMTGLAGAAWAALAPFWPIILALGALAAVIYVVGKQEQWGVSQTTKATNALGKMKTEVDKQTKARDNLKNEIAELEKKEKSGKLTTEQAAENTRILNEKRAALTTTTNNLTQAEKDYNAAQGKDTEVKGKFAEAQTQTDELTENRKKQYTDLLVAQGKMTKEEAANYSSYVGDYNKNIKGVEKDLEGVGNRAKARQKAFEKYMDPVGSRFVTKANYEEYIDVLDRLSEADAARFDPSLTEDQRKQAELDYQDLLRQRQTLDNIREMKKIWAGIEWQVGGAGKKIQDFWKWLQDGYNWLVKQTPPEAITGTKDALKLIKDTWDGWMEKLKAGIPNIPGLQQLVDLANIVTGGSASTGGGSSGGTAPTANATVSTAQSTYTANKDTKFWNYPKGTTKKTGSPLGIYDSSGIGPPLLRFPQLTPGFLKGLEDQTSYGAGATKTINNSAQNTHLYHVTVDARHMSEEQLMAMFINISERYSRPKKIPVAR